jgi:DNA-binding Lrp family transcriptional regulator
MRILQFFTNGSLDDLDRVILNLLIANGRISARNIVKILEEKGIKISERGVGKRMEKLEHEKVILGYTTMVDLQKVNMATTRLVTVKFTSPKDYLQRMEEMKKYLTESPFCDFSARTNGDIDWIEIKFFNNHEQAKKEEDLYRSWFGDIIEDYKSYDLDIQKWGWQIFDEANFDRFMQQVLKNDRRVLAPSPSVGSKIYR